MGERQGEWMGAGGSEETRLGIFEFAGVLGWIKAGPRAGARSLEDSRALIQPATRRRGRWVLEQ